LKVRVRLAPSPTGNLHIGTARTALYNWLYAKSTKGEFLLRIEDTDQERSNNKYKENILDGLRWLGLDWDQEPVIQSSRIDQHLEAIESLLKNGQAYRCYATDQEMEELKSKQKLHGEAPRYDNRYRDLSAGEEKRLAEEGRDSVIRFKIDDESIIQWNDLIRGKITWQAKDLGGDMVIARKSKNNQIGIPLYNLAVVIDDSNMNITHVIRGEDHIANTAKQILLYKALNLKIPNFAHTPLILNQEGRKLSKRDGVTSISEFREMGYTPDAINNYMTLLGWSIPEGNEEIFTKEESINLFTLEKVNKAGAKFDWDKLNWINSQKIHKLAPNDLLSLLEPIWNKEGWRIQDKEWAIDLVSLIGPSMVLITDGIKLSKPFFEDPIITSDGKDQLNKNESQLALKTLLKEVGNNPWDGNDLNRAKEIITKVTKLAEVKKGIVMRSLRAALLGELNGPDLLSTWSLLRRSGKDIYRLNNAIGPRP
tara:strand:+ start:6168 stop:7610 length:1443 start_codon:yes stop_codon:yes gene_type:complete